MINKAKELCSDPSDDVGFEAYKFTSAHLSWPKGTRIGEGQSALIAYQSRIGVCGEFANLMTTLNRSCDNPARSINGLSMPMYLPPMMTKERLWMHPGGAHAWVEFYDRDHWTIADPSWASNMPFDRVWFGRSMGQYLSYGETGKHEQVFEEMIQWGEENGDVIGAMSAPLRFVSSSEDNNNITLKPIVSVRKVRDVRWLFAAILYFVIIAASSIVEYRIGNKELSMNTD